MKKVLLLTCILVFHFCGTIPMSEDQLRTSVVETASMYLGTPYKSGGTKETGFDCSGFARFVMDQNSIKISRSSKTQISDGFPIPIEAVRPGDLLIFKGRSKKTSRAGHSAIVHHVSEDGTVYFIHSATSSGVIVSNLNESYYKNRFLEARDVISWALVKE